MAMKPPNLEALNSYILARRSLGFQWHTNDCFMFTNGAYRSMYGVGYADDWVGKYTSHGLYLKRDELRRVFKFQTLEEALDAKLKRINYVPPRGALVTTKATRRWVLGEALGICVGSSAVFLGKESLISLPVEQINNSWVLA